MTDELPRLLVEQAVMIASVKRVLVNFKKLAKANVTLCKTKCRFANLTALWEKCQNLHVRILQTATAEEQRTLSYLLDEEFLVAEDAFNEAIEFLHDTIGKLGRSESSAAKNHDSTSVESNSGLALQLPQISLPKFSGSLTEWENFHGNFDSLVASNDALSNTQKLHYLKASVTGDAALLISSLQITDANYDAAWQLLMQEYNNKHAIIHAHIHLFADLPIMKTKTAADLRRLRDIV